MIVWLVSDFSLSVYLSHTACNGDLLPRGTMGMAGSRAGHRGAWSVCAPCALFEAVWRGLVDAEHKAFASALRPVTARPIVRASLRSKPRRSATERLQCCGTRGCCSVHGSFFLTLAPPSPACCSRKARHLSKLSSHSRGRGLEFLFARERAKASMRGVGFPVFL